MNDRILVDTSAWVKFFREGADNQGVADEVERLILDDCVCYSEPVYIELVIGAKVKGGIDELKKLFSVFPVLRVDEKVWHDAVKTAIELRRNGLRVDVPDLLVASTAVLNEATVYHHDKHFQWISSLGPLNEYSLLGEKK